MTASEKHIALTIIEYAIDNDLRLFESYSGRGMAGRTCIGISVANDGEVDELLDAIVDEVTDAQYEEVAEDEMKELVAEARRIVKKGSRRDSLGMGRIIYWPYLESTDELLEDVRAAWG